MTFRFITGALVERSFIPIKEFPNDPENEMLRDAQDRLGWRDDRQGLTLGHEAVGVKKEI